MKNLAIYCLAMLGLQSANAIELTHRNYTFNAMQKIAWTSGSLPFAFVSEIDVRREVNTFSSNSGLLVLNVLEKVTSEYDATSNNYVMTPFYTGFKQRQHLISNFSIPSTNTLLSIGFDSGSKSQKISISRTFFVGFSTYKKIDTKSALFLMAGGWQKERIKEQPCVDSYDREYWCPALTAWTDYKPLTATPLRFAEVRYERRF